MSTEQEPARPGWARRAYQRAYAGQDYLATKLAFVFGFGWTIWVFFIIPLLAPAFSARVQAQIFYFASGWIQLFALPLMVYVSNKIQHTADLASQEQQHILQQMDETLGMASAAASGNHELLERIQQLIQQNTELTTLTRDLLEQNTALTREVRIAINGRSKGHE